MAVDKYSQDAMAKLYAEWVSAGVKLSLAGFTATAKILEAAGQSAMSARAKAHAAETAKPEPAPAAAKPEAKAATVMPLKVVPKTVTPTKAETAKPEAIAKAEANVAPVQAKAVKPANVQADAIKPAVAENDLKMISGIGPKLEQMLIRKGVTTFAQIAALDSAAATKLDAELNLNGRIQRDDWVGQAATLAGNVGGQTWQN